MPGFEESMGSGLESWVSTSQTGGGMGWDNYKYSYMKRPYKSLKIFSGNTRPKLMKESKNLKIWIVKGESDGSIETSIHIN